MFSWVFHINHGDELEVVVNISMGSSHLIIIDEFQVLRAYAENKPWALGFLMDIVGALLMLRALSLAPVSKVFSIFHFVAKIVCL
jgi:hypothetical protein